MISLQPFVDGGMRRTLEGLSVLAIAEKPITPPPLKIVDALGRGGFSIVLKIIDMPTGKAYAMKKIKKKLYTTDLLKNQLHMELQTLQDLNMSPFVQPCISIFEDVLFVYVTFEQLYGDLFSHLLTRTNDNKYTSFSIEQSRIILAELCLAIEHIHSHYIVHRDIKVMRHMFSNMYIYTIVVVFIFVSLHTYSKSVYYICAPRP